MEVKIISVEVVSGNCLNQIGKNPCKKLLLTKECNRERFELIHKNYPEIDMNVVIPNEGYMCRFLDLIEQQYGSIQGYFTAIGITEKEQRAIRSKLADDTG